MGCFVSKAVVALAVFAVTQRVAGAPPAQPPAADRLVAAQAALDAWLGDGENAQRWQNYLRSDELKAELAKGAAADPASVARVLQQFNSKAKGLELAPFAAVRKELGNWLRELKRQYESDPERMAWASRGDHTPITAAQFSAVRAELRNRAQALEKFLGGNTRLAQNWKRYLKWELLQPHLGDDFQASRKSLLELEEVLARFHANQPGLELPAFVEAAKAIARYRAIARWELAAKVRDSRQEYERLLSSIGAQLQRHVELPTTETAWKAGRLLGIVDGLGQSEDFVQAVRNRFVQANISASVSANFVLRMPERDINQVRPVRDCILGTSIFGTSHTLGSVRYELEPSENDARLVLHLEGEAASRTRGYNGPVRVNTRGKTTFSAKKRVTLSEAAFLAAPAVAAVDTRTRITSINKTGGPLGHRIIEKIAWKKAGEQKRQSEIISARHTQERIIREFNERAAKDLADARTRYEEKIGDPLVRRGVKPEHLRLYSATSGLGMETTFAGRNQLGANSRAPAPMPGHDLTVQIHESAVNNYLPLALSAARIAQENADQEPELKGNMPNWFKLTSIVRPKLAAAASAGVEMVEEAQERIEEAIEGEESKPEKATTPPFKPYSITLNAEAPVSIRFDDGKIAVRVRAAVLAADGSEYTNWDFIVTYQIAVDGDRILLKRVGDIEVFPTGFDPAWDKQLTAQQSGFRSTLAKNMNARAKAGQSFPDEIPIDPVRFSRFGVMVLRELVADDGWLTVGWTLPEASGPPPQSAPKPPAAG